MELHLRHRKTERLKQDEEKPRKFEGEYLGGHPAYTEKKKTDVLVYHDRIEIDVEEFPSCKQGINDYQDGNVVVDFFSRHNTLEEYIKLLNEASRNKLN
jgi:hypothetical protein